MSSIEDFKEAWKELEIEEEKRGFLSHLISYIIVNAFLVFVNLYTSPKYLWFPWVIGGWGIGIAFHFAFSRERFVIAEWEKKVAKVEMRVKRKTEKH
jgi:hypothetical protein